MSPAPACAVIAHSPLPVMPVLTPTPPTPATDPAAAAPAAAGPACSLQRTGSLWQLGIEAQELTTGIAQLAEQLETEDPEQRSRALAELEAALLAEEGNRRPSLPRPMPPAG